MNCDRVRSFFDRIYREKERFDRSDVLTHIKQCEECARVYERWCDIARTLESALQLDPPPALYGTVMRAISRPSMKSRAPLFRMLWKPLPYGAACAALFLCVFFYFYSIGPQTVSRTPPVSSSSTGPEEVTAHFEITSAGARRVALVGDFNGWDTERHTLTKTDEDTWKIDLRIPKGCYQYLFLVDGMEWKTDSCRTELVPDGFGGFNTVIEL